MLQFNHIKQVLRDGIPGWEGEIIQNPNATVTIYLKRAFWISDFMTMKSFANALAPALDNIQRTADKIRKPKRPLYRRARTRP